MTRRMRLLRCPQALGPRLLGCQLRLSLGLLILHEFRAELLRRYHKLLHRRLENQLRQVVLLQGLLHHLRRGLLELLRDGSLLHVVELPLRPLQGLHLHHDRLVRLVPRYDVVVEGGAHLVLVKGRGEVQLYLASIVGVQLPEVVHYTRHLFVSLPQVVVRRPVNVGFLEAQVPKELLLGGQQLVVEVRHHCGEAEGSQLGEGGERDTQL